MGPIIMRTPPPPTQSCSAIFSRSFLAEHNIEYRGEGDIMHLWADVLNYLQTLRVSQVFLQLVQCSTPVGRVRREKSIFFATPFTVSSGY